VVGVSAPRSVHLVSAHEVVETWHLTPTYTAVCGELVHSAAPENPECPNECECDCEVVYCSACLRMVIERNGDAGVDVDCPPGIRVRVAR
jgi:hypothetical protein